MGITEPIAQEAKTYFFEPLQWDTEYFDVPCAKATLTSEVTEDERCDLRELMDAYTFVTIVNRDSVPENARWIGAETNAYLVDVNIQFEKKPEASFCDTKSIRICPGMERDEGVLKLVDFQFIRFIQDKRLLERGGDRVYRELIKNAFGRTDKIFAIAESEDKEITGFLMYSYSYRKCFMEHIAVARNSRKSGIGTALIRAVEKEAYTRGCDRIVFGANIRNTGPINLYHRLGFVMTDCNEVYHLWNG